MCELGHSFMLIKKDTSGKYMCCSESVMQFLTKHNYHHNKVLFSLLSLSLSPENRIVRALCQGPLLWYFLLYKNIKKAFFDQILNMMEGSQVGHDDHNIHNSIFVLSYFYMILEATYNYYGLEPFIALFSLKRPKSPLEVIQVAVNIVMKIEVIMGSLLLF